MRVFCPGGVTPAARWHFQCTLVLWVKSTSQRLSVSLLASVPPSNFIDAGSEDARGLSPMRCAAHNDHVRFESETRARSRASEVSRWWVVRPVSQSTCAQQNHHGNALYHLRNNVQLCGGWEHVCCHRASCSVQWCAFPMLPAQSSPPWP